MLRNLVVLISLMAACGTTEGNAPGPADLTPSGQAGFRAGLESLRAEHGYVSLTAAVFENGAVRYAAAVGQADASAGTVANADTIYQIASCSKPVIGLAIARLVQLENVDLDADIGPMLGWSVRHPDYPDVPVTLRQLATHRAGLESDGPDDYATYPKPDPSVPLEQYLRGMLAQADYWLETAPGEAEEYSNLGAALAALVVEKVDGRPFNRFCNEEIFAPLGMADTRWHFSELSAAQQARVARPHEDGETLRHYSYNDWPSGALRTTPRDFAKLWLMVAGGGKLGGVEVLSSRALTALHGVPLFLDKADVGGVQAFEHSGGETGVTGWVRYLEDGRGVIYFANSALEDDAEEAAHEAIEAFLESHWSRR